MQQHVLCSTLEQKKNVFNAFNSKLMFEKNYIKLDRSLVSYPLAIVTDAPWTASL